MSPRRGYYLSGVTALVAVLVLMVLAVVSAGCGNESASSTSASASPTSVSAPTSSTTTSSSTEPTCSASRLDLGLFPQQGLVSAVASARAAVFNAARSCDYQALERLALEGPGEFTFTFGGADEGPAAYWRSAEERGEPVLAWLVTVLNMPYGRVDGLFVWPFAYALDFQNLTGYQTQLLGQYFGEGDIAGWKSFGGYVGYRVGIDETGDWVFFVAGD
ncbi:MAG: hypothetical protein V1912_11020 [bacterium]